VERYTEEADQAGLAEDAVIKLEAHKANRFTQTVSVDLGKAAKSERKSE
jgi:enterobacteria phage integrase